jgi:hypothetical protein
VWGDHQDGTGIRKPTALLEELRPQQTWLKPERRCAVRDEEARGDIHMK